MLESLFKGIDQPSETFEYPGVFPGPTDLDRAITEFVRANHTQLSFIDPPTRQDTFELVKGSAEIIAIASQGVRVYFIALPGADQAVSLERQKSEGMALRLDYMKIPPELLGELGKALKNVHEIEIVKHGW